MLFMLITQGTVFADMPVTSPFGWRSDPYTENGGFIQVLTSVTVMVQAYLHYLMALLYKQVILVMVMEIKSFYIISK